MSEPRVQTPAASGSMANEAETNGRIDWSAELIRHKPWLTKVLRSRIGDQHDVEDVWQEIAVSVLRQSQPDQGSSTGQRLATAPDDPQKVAAWLYRIAVRQAVNFYRKINRTSHAKPTDELDPQSRDPEPLQWLLDREHQHRLQEVLKRLRPADREILTLKYSENWSYKELSEHLGVPVGSVEYRLAEARKRLRRLLGTWSKTTFAPSSCRRGLG